MLTSFKEITALMKIKADKVVIDDLIFRMYYRATFLILLASSILVTQRKFVGQHIKCITKTISDDVINNYCFFSGTFTAVKHLNNTALDLGYLPHPGVGPVTDEDETIDHLYYQWVPFVLFLQAFMFYIPHYLWRKKEGGRLKMLVSGLRMAYYEGYEEDQKDGDEVVLPSKSTFEKKITTINTEFNNRLHAWSSWAIWLVSCEALNLLNLIFQVFLTDLFLGGRFFAIGREVIKNPDWNDLLDPLDVIFPKVSKCTYHKYGPSGDIQNHDAMCVMSLNVIHEKIYTILWFWFLFMFVSSILGLINRLITFIFCSRSVYFNMFMFKSACMGNHNRKDIKTLMKHCNFGDWIFIYFLARNMNIVVFTKFLDQLCESFNKSNKFGRANDEEPRDTDSLDPTTEKIKLEMEKEKEFVP